MCLGKFIDAMKSGVDVVIADNTFTRLWEVQNYLKAADLAGYLVEVYEFRLATIKEVEDCANRNVHCVPFDVVSRHASSFEPLPGARAVRMGRSE
jgi:hypothetical protein